MKKKHKRIAYIKYFCISFLLTMAIFIFNFSKVKAAPDTTLYFNPSSSSVAVDGDFTLKAMIDPGTNAVSAVTLHFAFDQTVLRLDSITPSSTFSLVLDDAVIDNTSGTASIDVAVPYSVPSIKSTSTMVVLKFHALTSTTNSSIAYTTASQAAADGESGDVVVSRIESLITITEIDSNSENTPTATSTSDTDSSYTFNSDGSGTVTYNDSAPILNTNSENGNSDEEQQDSDEEQQDSDEEQQDVTSPNAPANFIAYSINNQIRLSWKNPSDSDFVRVKLLRKIGSAITGINDPEAEVIYEGRAQEYIDTGLDSQTKYHYTIFAFDKKSNYSKLVNLEAQLDVNKEYIIQPKEQQQIKLNNLYNQSHEIVEQVSYSEANTVYSYNQFVNLDESTLTVYKKLAQERDFSSLEDDIKYSIAYFIHYGTPTTLRLGAGERAGVIDSFWKAFQKEPSSIEDWQDIIKISNGRWPKQTNINKEEISKQNYFKKIYKKDPNMNNSNENAAVTIITYGLRPVNRNMESEKAAIKTFEAIYNYSPTNASDWDIVRAVAYSGAVR